MGIAIGMGPLKRLAAWLSDLRLAIVLLLLIALASAVGTGIPQGCLLYTSPSPRDRG